MSTFHLLAEHPWGDFAEAVELNRAPILVALLTSDEALYEADCHVLGSRVADAIDSENNTAEDRRWERIEAIRWRVPHEYGSRN